MTIKGWAIAIVVVLILALGAIWISGKIHERHGQGSAQTAIGKSQERAGAIAQAKAETVYVKDTVRLMHAVAHYDTVRTTLNIHDTIQVEHFVVAADSVKKACTESVLTCDQRIAAHVAIEAGLRLQNQGLLNEMPTATEKMMTAGKWALVGAAIEAAASHWPGLAASGGHR